VARSTQPDPEQLGRRFRCTMRVDCGELDPSVVIQPICGEWHPHMPDRLDEEELADRRAPAATRSISSPHSPRARLAAADG
jgi:hypothetical protein